MITLDKCMRLGWNAGQEVARLGSEFGVTDAQIIEALGIVMDENRETDLRLRKVEERVAAYRQGFALAERG